MDEEAAVRAAETIVENRLTRGRLEFLPTEIRPRDLDEAYTVQERINKFSPAAAWVGRSATRSAAPPR